MIRPRVGDFCYSESEVQTMIEDIRIFKKAKIAGVVLGALTPTGHIDVQTTQR